jgi:hypothetical protein
LAPRRRAQKLTTVKAWRPVSFFMSAMTRPCHHLSPMLLLIGCALILMTAHSSVAAPGARYELFPEQEERWSTDHRTTSAYVLDKKDNRFWICTVRYNFNSEKDNNGDCQPLPGGGRVAVADARP